MSKVNDLSNQISLTHRTQCKTWEIKSIPPAFQYKKNNYKIRSQS